jgi:succinyl-CoA synthetase alpha subunit
VIKMRAYAQERGVVALGPTTPGILVPGRGKMGIMPAALFSPGRVGIISRSGTLSYEFAGILSEKQVGQSAVVGMGADPVVLTNLPEILRMFEQDDGTDAVIIVGEVGGEQEEKAAEFIARHMKKPVAAYIAGRFSPKGKRMGHAGAIVRGSSGTVEAKWEALKAAGVQILRTPIQVADWATGHKLQ